MTITRDCGCEIIVKESSGSIEYVKTYNKLTFKYLKKKYNKVWQSEIKKDAIGLNEF